MNRDHIIAEINLLERQSKQGESYSDGKDRYGWRNPIRKDTGPLLKSLVITRNPVNVLEIGTAHGLSALYLVDGFQDFNKQHLDTIDFDLSVAQSTQERMDRLNVPIKVHHGDALDVFPKLKTFFEIVFFDAQKNQYLPQLKSLIELGLIGDGTVILADNVLDRKEECMPFLKWFQENNINNHIITTECGLLVAHL
ncbi:MAG: O-methyltransferase [Bacteroidota bacterium]